MFGGNAFTSNAINPRVAFTLTLWQTGSGKISLSCSGIKVLVQIHCNRD